MLLGMPVTSSAGELKDAGRFCGYGPIIDLRAGETIVTSYGGIHGGGFQWTGSFGSLKVDGVQWASQPKGTRRDKTSQGHILFAQRKADGFYTVAIWNGRQGAAYFRSKQPLTKAQLKAIDRVVLFQEGEEPTGCKLRTGFSWE